MIPVVRTDLVKLFLRMERLAAIPGFPGYYASRSGHVFSTRPTGRSRGPGLAWKAERPDGRYGTHLKTNMVDADGKTRVVKLHHAVAFAFLDPPLPHQHVLRHLNGDGHDNRPENLRWGTQAENMREWARHRREKAGQESAIDYGDVAQAVNIPYYIPDDELGF